MCGIAGFWHTKRAVEPPVESLTRMGNALVHRGPDDSGAFFDDKAGLGLAFRRLSILDLSANGHQPMVSASGRYVIVFNGEVYNFEELRRELGNQLWRGHSDTEVMLEAIERWGLDVALGRFVGMFAFALWDRHEAQLHLVRDRLGIKPLYYGHIGADFAFASELKAIRQYPGFDGVVDRDALALYMRHNYVPTPHSIFKGIHKLPPGCRLVLKSSDGQPQIVSYWSAAQVAQQGTSSHLRGDDDEIVEHLQHELERAVRLRMISDVPLGAFLSGGVDSSAVVALMQSQSSRPVKTFTIGFHESDYNEAAHAKKIAAHLSTEHTELYMTAQDALSVVPLLPAIYDEPFADSSQIPTYLVSKLARSAVTVSLSGDGGDELFGGYNRYFLIKSLWNSLRTLPKPLRRLAGTVIRSIPPGRIDSAYRWLRPLLPKSRRWSAVGDKAHKLVNFLDAEDAQSIYVRSLSHWTAPSDVVLRSKEPDTVRSSIRQAASLPKLEEVMMLSDLINYLPDDILTKIDRASMAVSLEARVPLLDHRVVELAWRLPLHYKIRKGTSKWILRQILYKHVPAELIERPKMGFGVPIDQWLRGPLRVWAEDMLSAERLSREAFFNVDAVRRKWQEHLSCTRNWQYLLWDVLMFQGWLARASCPQDHLSPVLLEPNRSTWN